MESLPIATCRHLSAMHPTSLCVTVSSIASLHCAIVCALLLMGRKCKLKRSLKGGLLAAFQGMLYGVCRSFGISTVHSLQVFQLLQPHFRYTLAINANARSSLINAGGVVEKVAPSR